MPIKAKKSVSFDENVRVRHFEVVKDTKEDALYKWKIMSVSSCEKFHDETFIEWCFFLQYISSGFPQQTMLLLLVPFGGPIQPIKESNQLGVLTMLQNVGSANVTYLRYIYDKIMS